MWIFLKITLTIGDYKAVLIISAQPNGTLQWNRDKVLDWERFTVEKLNDAYTFRSHHGQYISAQPKGGLEVNRVSASAWERFTVVTPWVLEGKFENKLLRIMGLFHEMILLSGSWLGTVLRYWFLLRGCNRRTLISAWTQSQSDKSRGLI